jgi:hypothetical protein
MLQLTKYPSFSVPLVLFGKWDVCYLISHRVMIQLLACLPTRSLLKALYALRLAYPAGTLRDLGYAGLRQKLPTQQTLRKKSYFFYILSRSIKLSLSNTYKTYQKNIFTFSLKK